VLCVRTGHITGNERDLLAKERSSFESSTHIHGSSLCASFPLHAVTRYRDSKLCCYTALRPLEAICVRRFVRHARH